MIPELLKMYFVIEDLRLANELVHVESAEQAGIASSSSTARVIGQIIEFQKMRDDVEKILLGEFDKT